MRILVALVLGAAALTAQTPGDRGKKIVNDALAAMGGERYLAMKDRVETGRGYSFKDDQLTGLSRLKIYARYLTVPEPPRAGFFGLRERQAFGKDEDVLMILTEADSYETTYRGAKPVDKETVERFRESTLHNILYILRMRLREPGMLFEYRRTEMFENQAASVVDITDGDNRQVTAWFSETTKLPLRQEWSRRDPRTRLKMDEVTVFNKYRDVGGGAMWPFVVMRERNGAKIYEMFADSVVINQDLTDDLFTLSAATKILEKKGRKE